MTHDFGLVGLQFAVVIGCAAVVLNRMLIRTVLVASLVFTIPHCLYHQHHPVAGSDVHAQLASQLLPIALALVLLVVNERTHRASYRGPDEATRNTPEGQR